MRRILLSAALLTAACQGADPTSADAGAGDAATQDISTAADALTQDATPVVDAGDDGFARLDYQPEGCMHRVHTVDGAEGNFRGDTTTFGAAPAPQAVHVNWPADPSNSVAVLWRTDADTRASVVQIGTSMNALDRTAVGHVSTGGSGPNAAPIHEVHLCGLTPDTTYYYRVGGEGHWSAVQTFKTAPAPGRADYDVNFAVTGDSRDNPSIFHEVQQAVLRTSGMRQPDFQVFTGDAVFLGQIQGLWDQWFESGAPTLSRMPFLMAHGNHEGLAMNYLVQFAQPQAESQEQDELYFSVDYGPIHFVMLNDTPRGGDLGALAGAELAWLRADLARARMNRARVPWIIAVHHKPCFGSSVHSDATDTQFIRRTWPPVYSEFGVDLVLTGHEHDFEISKDLDGAGQEVTSGRGTTYIIAGGAGAPLYAARTRPWTRYSESVSNFLLVHATNRVLEVTPHRGDGTVITQGVVSLTPRM